MHYNCVIVDDEDLARELIASHLNKLDDFKIVASCSSAVEAHAVIQKHEVDLLFLDIEMPVLRGNEFYKALNKKPKVIFTTAYREYALDGFELSAIDFLLKPIVFSRFLSAIEKFKATVTQPSLLTNIDDTESYIYVNSNKKNIKIEFDNILYIESIKDYLKIHLKNKHLIIKHTLSAFEEKVDARFLRVHRSFIVNMHYISAYTKHDIEIGDIELPIGDSYKENVFFKLNNT
ncbi:response regulator transcription factor [Fulvivirga sp. RKSG066]|uniref:LytR/AlgR family response regulator transcription factor n=1 Tax=Fulvivirga aurantia TaxID=2529383 RepID=UPI0012BC7B37|nr:LytTR family DNA-binding domain-containing protein [Fulvivirga aurantia]MTI21104.1 response regulator transcription factor [Fulvivirga aurantia]